MADKVAVLVAGGDGAEEREGEDRGAAAVTLLVRGEELDFIFQKTQKSLLQLEFEFIFNSLCLYREICNLRHDCHIQILNKLIFLRRQVIIINIIM